MPIIRVKPGSVIVELTEGNIMPVIARLQASIVVDAEIWPDDEGDHICQFDYNSKTWTADYKDVEVLS